MKRTILKALSLLLALCMSLSVFALAENAEPAEGENEEAALAEETIGSEEEAAAAEPEAGDEPAAELNGADVLMTVNGMEATNSTKRISTG